MTHALHRPATGSDPGRERFALVLSGGGARGFAHMGVLSVLERWGYRPAGIVGVSMGAVVGVTWSVRADWYEALLAMDTSAFPGPGHTEAGGDSLMGNVRRAVRFARTADRLLRSWGPGMGALDEGRRALEALLGDARLEDTRTILAVCSTDLSSGGRVVQRSGLARDAVYASAALAGVLPPVARGSLLLADGAYADIAPVDVARAMDVETVIAVDPGQLLPHPDIGNGLRAVLRAMEICHRKHADLRFEEADLVVRPDFRRAIDTLDFDAKREAVAAGVRGIRKVESRVRELLGPPVPVA